MPQLYRVPNCGSVGINRDLSQHDLPVVAWTDAKNIRFLDGSAWSFYGHTSIYGTASVVPYHLLPVQVTEKRYWMYMGLNKVYVVGSVAGVATHTNITKQSGGVDVDFGGSQNAITSTTIGGIPVINAGTTQVPQTWDLNVTHRLIDLPAWQAGVFCKAIRTHPKGFLVALNITKTAPSPNVGQYPYMVKWSNPAVPGAVPTSWDETDETKEAGEQDLATGGDPIVDGLALRDSFMIYKENSIWRMDYIGGPNIFQFSPVIGSSGAMNRNCIVEVDGFHIVLTGDDLIMHDGSQSKSLLDRQSRRWLQQHIDVSNSYKCFVFKSVYTNEVYACYPDVGSSAVNKALVYNYKERTVSAREMPSLNHAAFGPLESDALNTWAANPDPWGASLGKWGGSTFAPDRARVLMAPATTALYLLDGSASQDGVQVSWYLERRGLSLDQPELVKLFSRIRPRIMGNSGTTVKISVGWHNEPYDEPTYIQDIDWTIGTSVSADMMVSGRYLAIKFSSGTAFQVRIDSYDIEYEIDGEFF